MWELINIIGEKVAGDITLGTTKFKKQKKATTVIPRYPSASKLSKPCTQLHFDEKKMFQHLAFAEDLWRLLELV